jgi:hypothetical protein
MEGQRIFNTLYVNSSEESEQVLEDLYKMIRDLNNKKIFIKIIKVGVGEFPAQLKSRGCTRLPALISAAGTLVPSRDIISRYEGILNTPIAPKPTGKSRGDKKINKTRQDLSDEDTTDKASRDIDRKMREYQKNKPSHHGDNRKSKSRQTKSSDVDSDDDDDAQYSSEEDQRPQQEENSSDEEPVAVKSSVTSTKSSAGRAGVGRKLKQSTGDDNDLDDVMLASILKDKRGK